jgi:Tfp pilus tip-associated adhesin PilY1
VPIYVVALFPEASEVASLQAIAANSGGQYYEITQAMVDATTAGGPVPEIVRAINSAVQHGYVPSTTFNTAPSPAHPFGLTAEWQVTSPIVGTVNLRGASKIGSSGTPEALPDSETYIFTGTTEIPQRSNVLVTSAFELPGFQGQLRAFRTYKPIADSTKPSGYRFSQDGSRLWVSSTPAAGSRNIYTILPGTTTMIPFDAAHATDLQPHLGVTDAATLIEYIRALPLGAIVGSTPAFLDVPSLDPPPDADYPAFREDNKDRRALIFVGANDGMLHAFDARTGIEAWAFIPYNLLPKLRALRFGESLDSFSYFVDSSPKVADVKVGSNWRTYLFFGQGPGGTFYNTLDVTMPDLAESVSPISTDDSALLSYFASSDRITWKWSFPRNTSFDPSLTPYGELSATTASATELTIGETWSDPAIGQLQDEDGPYVMVTGSGFLKYSTQSTRRIGVDRAGTTFYVLDVATGSILGTPRDVGADAYAETLDDCRSIDNCQKMKNALQMDPVATGPSDQRFISKVYIGDLDGKVWRFNLSRSGGTVSVSTPTQLYDAGATYPLFSSMATVNVGSSNQYIFIGTGSDLQPSNGVNQSYSLLVLLDHGSTATKTAEILLERTDSPATTGGDEKVTSFPAVAGDIVFFTTTTYSPTTPCTPYSANLYAFTFIGGPAYDTNGDGSLSTGSTSSSKGKGGGGSTSADSQKVFSAAGVRATAPFIVDQHLVFSAGGNIQLFGDPNDFNNGIGQAGVRILSWRQVK